MRCPVHAGGDIVENGCFNKEVASCSLIISSLHVITCLRQLLEAMKRGEAKVISAGEPKSMLSRCSSLLALFKRTAEEQMVLRTCLYQRRN